MNKNTQTDFELIDGIPSPIWKILQNQRLDIQRLYPKLRVGSFRKQIAVQHDVSRYIAQRPKMLEKLKPYARRYPRPYRNALLEELELSICGENKAKKLKLVKLFITSFSIYSYNSGRLVELAVKDKSGYENWNKRTVIEDIIDKIIATDMRDVDAFKTALKEYTSYTSFVETSRMYMKPMIVLEADIMRHINPKIRELAVELWIKNQSFF